MLLNVAVHLFPELRIRAPELFHQIVHRYMVLLLYPEKLKVHLL